MNHQLSQRDAKLNTINDVVVYSSGTWPEDIAFSWREGKDSVGAITYRRLKENVYSISNYLASKGLSSAHVSLIGENSIEWVSVYLGVTVGGGVIVPIDKELSGDEIEELVVRSDSKAVFYSGSYGKKIEAFKASHEDVLFIRFDELEKIVSSNPSTEPVNKPQADDLASIVYTSGTTGQSKGVMLSHRNLVSDTVSGLNALACFTKTINVLPLHHTFGLITNLLGPMVIHAEVFICKSIRRVSKDIVEQQPDILMLVPVIAELLYKKLIEGIKTQGKYDEFQKGLKISNGLMKLHIDKRRKLFDEIHKNLGGKLDIIIVGGAPCSREIQQNFEDIGISFYNGYGITECSPIVAVSPDGKNRFGTVGPALDCNRVRLVNKDADGNGHIQISGSNVMLGYYDDDEQTEQTFDGKWFKTGDIGKLDKDGYIMITGRAKNLIILSNGKNVSPEEIEEKLLTYEVINEVVVYAEGESLTAEVYSIDDPSDEVREQINQAVDSYNKSAPNYKTIQKVVVRDREFEKTTTLKIKRKYKES